MISLFDKRVKNQLNQSLPEQPQNSDPSGTAAAQSQGRLKSRFMAWTQWGPKVGTKICSGWARITGDFLLDWDHIL